MNILDLPQEILLIIFRKLYMIETLYSLVNVNQRFDNVILHPYYIRHLNLTIPSLFDHNFQLNNEIFNRIRTKIFPRINHKVIKLIIEPRSMECILDTIDYPILKSLSLVNFQSETLLQYLTVLLSIGKCLTDLTFGQRWIDERIEFSFFDLPSIRCVSSSLTKLDITLHTFNDCLYLLDGRLKHLSILIIDIMTIEETSLTIDNTKNLPELKCFSLRTYWYTYGYDNCIVSLLRRMLNLEELRLFLSVIRNKPIYIDGTQLYNDFLMYMPRLDNFLFSIHTTIFKNENDINLPSNNDILNSFLERGYKQVNLYADEQFTCNWSSCHVYSLPYHFKDFLFMTSRFQGGIFSKVQWLVMYDKRPFENELFEIISQDFPLLKRLLIINRQSQKYKQHSPTIITFPYLNKLNLSMAHRDYAIQFLFDKNTSLPCLRNLTIKYQTLTSVTEGFTNNDARRTCARIESLVIREQFVCPENFSSYFPSL